MGHDVFFYHSQSGGCCDCGDTQAWSKHGFCRRHGKTDDDPIQNYPSDLIKSANEVLGLIVNATVSFWEEYQRFVIQSIDVTHPYNS